MIMCFDLLKNPNDGEHLPVRTNAVRQSKHGQCNLMIVQWQCLYLLVWLWKRIELYLRIRVWSVFRIVNSTCFVNYLLRNLIFQCYSCSRGCNNKRDQKETVYANLKTLNAEDICTNIKHLFKHKHKKHNQGDCKCTRSMPNTRKHTRRLRV